MEAPLRSPDHRHAAGLWLDKDQIALHPDLQSPSLASKAPFALVLPLAMLTVPASAPSRLSTSPRARVTARSADVSWVKTCAKWPIKVSAVHLLTAIVPQRIRRPSEASKAVAKVSHPYPDRSLDSLRLECLTMDLTQVVLLAPLKTNSWISNRPLTDLPSLRST